jgi:Lipid A 3-O-deacylase (PagL)
MHRWIYIVAILLANAAAYCQTTEIQKNEFGVSYSYAPDSSHIIIGASEQRRLYAAEIDYARALHVSRVWRTEYIGTVAPFFQISDPVLTGQKCYIDGKPTQIATYSNPARVIFVRRGPTGQLTGAPCQLTYDSYARETTDGFSLSPIGTRIAFSKSRYFQPYFTTSVGFVVSTRDIPVDQSSHFNYTFNFGFGLEMQERKHIVPRLEYRYMHISNANSGLQNPGIDFGNIRVTLSYRK